MASSASAKKKAEGRKLRTTNLQEALRALNGEDGKGDVVELDMSYARIGDEGAKAIGEALKSNGTLSSLDLGTNNIGDEGARAIGEGLKSNGSLTALNLWRNEVGDEGTTVIGEALKLNGTLSSLDLGHNQIGDEGAKEIGEALKVNGALGSMILRNNQIGDEGAKAIGNGLKSNGTLTSLRFSENPIGDEGAKAIGDALKSNGTLSSLNLGGSFFGGNQIGAEGAKAIGEGLILNGALTELILTKGRIGDDGAIAILASLASNKSLMNLELEGISIRKETSVQLYKLAATNICDDEAKTIAAVLGSRPFSSLDLFGNQIGDKGAKTIGEALKVNRTLTRLSLRMNRIGAEGAKAIGEALKANGTLTSLRFSENRIGDEGAKAIGEALKSNGALTSLDLYRNRIGDAGAKAIGEALKSNGTLSKLNFTNNRIGDAGAKEIGGAMRVSGTLTSMILWNNRIGNEGAKAIGEALKSNGTLTTLDLRTNGIGDEGAKAIGEALKANGTLTRLDLSSNEIGDEGAIALFCSLEHRGSSASDDGSSLDCVIGRKIPATSGTSFQTPTPALDMIKRLIEKGKGSFAVKISKKFGTAELKAFAKGWHQLKQEGIGLLMPPGSVIRNGSKNIVSYFTNGAHRKRNVAELIAQLDAEDDEGLRKLARKRDVNKPDDRGRSALSYCAEKGYSRKFDMLMDEFGGDINKHCNYEEAALEQWRGLAPLHIAILKKYTDAEKKLDVCRFMLGKGADPNLEAGDGKYKGKSPATLVDESSDNATTKQRLKELLNTNDVVEIDASQAPEGDSTSNTDPPSKYNIDSSSKSKHKLKHKRKPEDSEDEESCSDIADEVTTETPEKGSLKRAKTDTEGFPGSSHASLHTSSHASPHTSPQAKFSRTTSDSQGSRHRSTPPLFSPQMTSPHSSSGKSLPSPRGSHYSKVGTRVSDGSLYSSTECNNRSTSATSSGKSTSRDNDRSEVVLDFAAAIEKVRASFFGNRQVREAYASRLVEQMDRDLGIFKSLDPESATKSSEVVPYKDALDILPTPGMKVSVDEVVYLVNRIDRSEGAVVLCQQGSNAIGPEVPKRLDLTTFFEQARVRNPKLN